MRRAGRREANWRGGRECLSSGVACGVAKRCRRPSPVVPRSRLGPTSASPSARYVPPAPGGGGANRRTGRAPPEPSLHRERPLDLERQVLAPVVGRLGDGGDHALALGRQGVAPAHRDKEADGARAGLDVFLGDRVGRQHATGAVRADTRGLGVMRAVPPLLGDRWGPPARAPRAKSGSRPPLACGGASPRGGR